MPAAAVESLLKRDKRIVAGALAAATVLSWIYLVWLSRTMTMPGMSSMPDMPGMDMGMPAAQPWTATDFAFTFVMWAIMMVGMMTPSAAPMILLYARVANHAVQHGRALASSLWFSLGYLLGWTGFSVIATVAQGLLHRAALLSPMMSLGNSASGIVAIVAGIYQWTPLKRACLQHCRAPANFIQHHGGFRPGTGAAVRFGLLHSVYCIGCCWALMALLFAGGVMSIFWIAALAVLVLIEKVIPGGEMISKVVGAGLVAFGIWLLAPAFL
jgi:predicted metal-binding membrane protein